MGNACLTEESTEVKVIYDIMVKTCDGCAEASTDSSISIKLIGESEQATSWLKLDNFLKDDFQRGQVNHFRLPAEDVGLPKVVRLKIQHFGEEDEWMCERIVVKINDFSAEFPVYDWVYDEMDISRGKATLSQEQKIGYELSQRAEEVTRCKDKFLWASRPTPNDIGWGLPRHLQADLYSDLPRLCQRDEIRQKNFTDTGFMAVFNAAKGIIDGLVHCLDSLEDYRRIYKHQKFSRPDNNCLDGWDTDEGMGRLTLNSVNPLIIQRCTSLPDDFNVTDDDVGQFLRDGASLQSEMEAGKMYISNLSEVLSNVERNVHQGSGKPMECANAICLFYVNCDGKFLPIAIQLVPGDRDYLFTPADDSNDWLLAKMYYRCAQANYHQWILHFLFAHNVTETFAVATFRNLPRCHPIFKLLRPHIRHVAAINVDARQKLIPPSGIGNKVLATYSISLMRKVFKTFHFDTLIIPKLLEKLGLLDRTLLPNFYYRDDAMELWEILERYVTATIKYYYQSDQNVVKDKEIQQWAYDMATEGFGWQDGNARGVPDHIESISQLVELCQTIIFTSSVQHSAVNFGQFDAYKFVPSHPSSMRLPPHKKGEGSMDRIMNSLPDLITSGTSAALSFVLSSYSPDEVYLGTFKEKLFAEEEVLKIQETYKSDLDAFSEKVKERNKSLKHPYTYLIPEMIPNEIAI